MLIADAEVLKNQLTDKYVVVNESVPELRRFVGLTGRVRTVNMNCRALVEFDGPVDISWYDIDPSFLTVVDAPLPKEKAQPKKAAQEKKTGEKTAKKAPAKGASPLEMARKQGAAGAGGGEKKLSPLEMARQQGAAGNAPAAATEKKLSPLELARQQGAAGGDSAPSPAPAPAAEASSSGKKLSPLELARQQGAAKSEEAEVEAPAAEDSKASTEATSTETPSSTEEIIALARKQGAFEG